MEPAPNTTPRSPTKLWIPLAIGAAMTSACSKSTEPAQPQLSYHKDVRPLIETHCLECHQQGGIGPFVLDSFAAVKAAGPVVAGSVMSGRMPPWLPDPDCNHFQGERLMTEDQKSAIASWVEQGMEEGDASEYVPGPTARGLTLADLEPPTMTLKPEQPYVPDPERPDDYRCFVLDQTFEQETYMASANIVPDQQQLVHHVILYLVEPQFAQRVIELDAQDPALGYGCFGGVGAGSPQPIAGWVPGSAIREPLDGIATRIPAGSKLVMQMHYNTLSTDAQADQTEVRLWMSERAPDLLLESRFFAHIGIDIPAGDADSSHERVFWNNSNEPWTLVATSPHMHLLGKTQKLTHIKASGEEQCVIDIPRWDFNWQQSYSFMPDQTLVVQPGEGLRLKCSYDNSAANQPIVNGTQLEPERVTWGEGTLDEMCLNSLTFVQPFAPLPEPQALCEDFQGCYDECLMQPNGLITGCTLTCSSSECLSCTMAGLIGCVIDDCGPQANEMLRCFEECGREGDAASCVATDCVAAIVGFDFCAAPYVQGGRCTTEADACGVTL